MRAAFGFEQPQRLAGLETGHGHERGQVLQAGEDRKRRPGNVEERA